ncbi:unnamed protein product [Ceratitis capitata]|uniref:(Mediterranean fruit fly) hypothetical protein n=1 Tax=Ceratitis capitata TaxID=7213 RepID=A0A811V9I7_CERCA|nr:unnamed protein product [Ceratitis capitata]
MSNRYENTYISMLAVRETEGIPNERKLRNDIDESVEGERTTIFVRIDLLHLENMILDLSETS